MDHNSPADKALAHLHAALTMSSHIGVLHEAGATGNDPRVRKANADVGVALKAAGVYAELAVADEVARLRTDVLGLLTALEESRNGRGEELARATAGYTDVRPNRCPHGRTVASRRDNPCRPGLEGCAL